jgi:membrane protein DedA with SNARE-associated domain
MSEWISQWITNTMSSMGYLGIGLLMFLENLFPPIPSELIMPLAGFTIAQGKMEFIPAVTAGVVGTVLGAFPWYYAGKFIGEPRLRDLADRYGKWLTISGKDIDKANDWFTRHEGKAVFFCRLVPGVRTLISLPAGISRMPLIPFVLYSTLGTTIWVSFLTFLGVQLGENYEKVDEWLAPLSKLVLGGLILGFAFWIWKRKQAGSRRRRTGR